PDPAPGPGYRPGLASRRSPARFRLRPGRPVWALPDRPGARRARRSRPPLRVPSEGVALMRLVAAKPGSKPVPDAIRNALEDVSPDLLRAVVERIAVPRVYGTPENLVVRGMVVELLSTALACDRAIPRVDDAGNVVAGDPRSAWILLGAHYDAVP